MSLGKRAAILRKNDHIRIANTDTGGYALLCLHCGKIYVPSLPISLDMFLAVSKQFNKEHKDCACPPTGQLDAEHLLQKADLRHLNNIERKGNT